MKKISVLLIILLLFICSCGKKEYKTIEVTSYDLVNAINNNTGNFVFAIYNTDFDNSDAFLKDLNYAADRADINIYYIDYKHSTIDTASYLIYDLGYSNYEGQFYGVFENGKVINSGYYTDFSSMYENIYKSRYDTNIKKTTEEEELEYIDKAMELYDENKYNSAIDMLNHAWTNNKAKEYYDKYNYFKLAGIWESYGFLDKDFTKMDFHALYFLGNNDDYCLIYSAKNQIYDGFKKPVYSDLSRRYYYIKDDIIYMSSKEDGKYEAYYKIELINDIDLKLIDLKDKNKELSFQRRD